MGLVSEIRRRNVHRMAVLYVVAAWLIMQVAEVIIGLANLPEWIGLTILGLLAVGFPIALIFSWFYELTPEGISLEKDVEPAESITHVTGRRMDFIVISLMAAAIIFFAYDKWWIGPPPERSIAVLPFENMSGDPEQEYFSDGISEELLNLLAQIPELTVISRSSSFSFKDKDVDLRSIAEQLNVAHVLEGSVRKAGNRVRIKAQLIDARSDSHLWSQTYDREIDDIFALQDEVATAITDAMKVSLALTAGGPLRGINTKTASIEAYEAYLQGRGVLSRGGSKNLEEAIHHFEHALRFDDNFAPAHAELAIAIINLQDCPGCEGTLPRAEVLRRAVPHLDRAEELVPNLAEAHIGRALLALDTNDNESVIDHAKTALALNPSDSRAMNSWQWALGDLGRYEEAEAVLEKALKIDPMNILALHNYSNWLNMQGRYEEAHEYANRLIARGAFADGYRRHSGVLLYRGAIAEALSWSLKANVELRTNYYSSRHTVRAFTWVSEFDEARRVDDRLNFVPNIAEGNFDEAVRGTQRQLQMDPENEAVIFRAGVALYHAGRFDEALALYERLREFHPADRPIHGDYAMMQLALLRRKAGDNDGAQLAIQIVRKDLAALHAAIGYGSPIVYLQEAMISAFERDPNPAIRALEAAIRKGFRDPQFLADPIFEEMWDELRFIALQEKLDVLLATEHDKVLQLVCFNNPVPDDWQPLPETCEGVEQQPSL